jgi:gas vesicle protein
MSENSRLSQGLLVGFLAGGAVGAVLGLLYAPKSGKELRGDIRQKSGEIANDVDEYLKDAQAKAKQLINEGKEKSGQMIQDARKKAEDLLHDAETVLQGAKTRVNEESGKLKGAVRAGVDAYKNDPGKEKDKEKS